MEAEEATVHDLPCRILSLPCYEPGGLRIDLTGEALTRNTLLTGAVGSGKTTTLNEMLYQLIGYRADEPAHKAGLLIFDFKQDDTVGKVRAWAREHGREADVRVLCEGSPHHLDLFGGFTSLAQLESTVDALTAAAPREDPGNPYWEHARRKRLTMALGLWRLVKGGRLENGDTLAFLQRFLSAGVFSADIPEVEAFEDMAARLPADLPERLRLFIGMIRTGIREWKELDGRTRSNEQSTLSNMLAPLTGYAAYGYLGQAGRTPLDLREIVDAGRIVVVSAPALSEPKLASCIGRLVKSQFYAAVQGRALGYTDAGRMAGIIMDEFPLIATGDTGRFSDVTQLQALRSMRGFAIAATQGFKAISRRIGAEDTEALLAQFHQHFFFKTRESAVCSYANRLFGTKPAAPPPPQGIFAAAPDFGAAEAAAAAAREPTCTPDELGRMEPGQAYVWTEELRALHAPVWLAGRHSPPDTAAAARPAEDEEAAWEARLRDTPAPGTREDTSVPGSAGDASPQQLNGGEGGCLDWSDLYPECFDRPIAAPADPAAAETAPNAAEGNPRAS